jgi:5'-nucleotidase
MSEPYILLTNDDGINAPGLHVLERVAQRIGSTLTVAPATEMSAVGQMITLHEPVRIEECGSNRFALRTGTPTDCVFTAISHISAERTPTLVLSGINYGVNVAQDIVYSGTVAGAREGILQGIPSLSFSMETGPDWDPTFAMPYIEKIVSEYVQNPALHSSLLNVNIPHPKRGPIRGIRATTLGSRRFENAVSESIDPRGKPYYWIGGNTAKVCAPEGSDCKAIQDGYISMTPVVPVAIDHEALAALSELQFN